MKSRGKLSLAVLLLTLAGQGLAEDLQTVSGTVVIDGRSGARALPKARVELLSPSDEKKILYQGFTDSKGRYLIRGVAVGEYELRIKLGDHPLFQVTKKGLVTTRRFRLDTRPVRLPDSVVRTQAG